MLTICGFARSFLVVLGQIMAISAVLSIRHVVVAEVQSATRFCVVAERRVMVAVVFKPPLPDRWGIRREATVEINGSQRIQASLCDATA